MAPTLLLAIECATDWLSVALFREGELVATARDEDRRQHAVSLLPTLERLLSEAGVDLHEIAALGVSAGPGSFTSLRIGLATAKGLGFTRALPAVGVSTLEAMALAALAGPAQERGGAERVVAALDARRGEWYAGGWSRCGAAEPGGVREDLQVILEEGLYSPGGLAARLDAAYALVTPESRAPAALDLIAALAAAGCRPVAVVPETAARPEAEWVGRVALRRLAAGEGVPVARLEARYLRRAQAEATRLGRPVERGVVAALDSQPAPNLETGENVA